VVAENVETGDGATTLSVEAPPGPRNQEDVVKYMLLIFSNPDNPHFTGDELDAVGAEVEALMGELVASGEWIGGEGLADPAQAKTVKVRDGSPAITDGPFAEAKEHLAGYCLFDCETEERALEIAARWPDARTIGVELRPLMTHDGSR
jgi:hypothetical protein